MVNTLQAAFRNLYWLGPLLPLAVHAKPVTFDFSGIAAPFGSGVYAGSDGQPVTGTFTIDSELVEESPGSPRTDQFVESFGNQAFTWEITVTINGVTRSSSDNTPGSHTLRYNDGPVDDRFHFFARAQQAGDSFFQLLLRDFFAPYDAVAPGFDNLTGDPVLIRTLNPADFQSCGPNTPDCKSGINSPEGTVNFDITAIRQRPLPPDPEISLSTGVNLVAPAIVVPEEADTCFELLDFLGGAQVVAAISRIDAPSQSAETCVYSGGSPAGTNFAVVAGEGYLVQALQDATIQLSGLSAGVAACAGSEVAAGANLIGVPQPDVQLTCFELLEHFGLDEAATIERLNPDGGVFESCTFDSAATIRGSDFSIRGGEAYLLHAAVALGTINPNTCLPACRPAVTGWSTRQRERYVIRPGSPVCAVPVLHVRSTVPPANPFPAPWNWR